MSKLSPVQRRTLEILNDGGTIRQSAFSMTSWVDGGAFPHGMRFSYSTVDALRRAKLIQGKYAYGIGSTWTITDAGRAALAAAITTAPAADTDAAAAGEVEA